MYFRRYICMGEAVPRPNSSPMENKLKATTRVNRGYMDKCSSFSIEFSSSFVRSVPGISNNGLTGHRQHLQNISY